ncbi:MAG TPA: hypothetical protein VHV28_01375 [Solirubrobacteraceae bacterium]|jgi:hypothetical protein|nr:hypothetical protein [Solirubrobacteraceae bacterium]
MTTETAVAAAHDAATHPAPPPPVQMVQLLAGFQIAQALYVAAKLDVATVLLDGAAGFRLERVVENPTPLSILEAVLDDGG